MFIESGKTLKRELSQFLFRKIVRQDRKSDKLSPVERFIQILLRA
jgi:hypothetical protein